MDACMRCGRRQAGPLHRTPTRLLCDACFDDWRGASAGVIAGGGVGGGIATAGWLRRIRRAIGR